MNKEEYIASYNLEINDNIARMTTKIDDKISEVWKIDKADVLQSLNWKQEKENLIKYLEDSMKLCQNDIKKLSENYNVYSFEINDIRARLSTYLEVLERLKSGKYE